MDYLPIFLDVRGRRAVLVGGDVVAERKLRWLLSAGAQVVLIAPALCPELNQRLAEAAVDWQARAFENTDLDGAVLVIAASDDMATNRHVAELARQRNMPVNVVDNAALSTFVVPALVDRSPVLVAVGSSATSPVLSRYWRNRLETLLPGNLGCLADFLSRQRERVQSALPSGMQRPFWETFLDGAGAEAVLAGNAEQAEQQLLQQLQQKKTNLSGEVYLIGAGPGDPDLMSFKALRLLQKADVVLYDRLVDARIIDKARRDAERVYVGKSRAEHALRQQDINRLMIERAQAGQTVARLKGGDPFLFGRGGEEIAELSAAGIAFQVVPGITAASGCAAYAGIPLTHRDHASSVRFLAGMLHNEDYALDWASLNAPRETLVFYMGLDTLPTISRELMAHGKAPDTPVAVVEQGTLEVQRVLISRLDQVADGAKAHTLHAPTLIIVGSVVNLHRQLAWYSARETYLYYP